MKLERVIGDEPTPTPQTTGRNYCQKVGECSGPGDFNPGTIQVKIPDLDQEGVFETCYQLFPSQSNEVSQGAKDCVMGLSPAIDGKEITLPVNNGNVQFGPGEEANMVKFGISLENSVASVGIPEKMVNTPKADPVPNYLLCSGAILTAVGIVAGGVWYSIKRKESNEDNYYAPKPQSKPEMANEDAESEGRIMPVNDLENDKRQVGFDKKTNALIHKLVALREKNMSHPRNVPFMLNGEDETILARVANQLSSILPLSWLEEHVHLETILNQENLHDLADYLEENFSPKFESDEK